MIKYLQTKKANKGFTMVELIIVITIIGVLAAITIPLFSNDDARVQSANIYANDFYTALQYTVTRYQTTDYHLSPKMQSQTGLMKYDPVNYGNRLAFDSSTGANTISYLYLEVKVDRGIQYVHASDSYQALIAAAETNNSATNELERLLEADLGEIINQANEGFYYAVIYEDSYHNLKVLCTNYVEGRLSATQSDLMFVDFGVLNNGLIAGTCSSEKYKTAEGYRFIGDISTYICGLDGSLAYGGSKDGKAPDGTLV